MFPITLATLHSDVFYPILNNILNKTIEYCILHPVKLELIFRKLPKKFGIDQNFVEYCVDYCDEDPELLKSYNQHEKLIREWISSLTWDSVIFPNIKSITAVSDNVGNNRGGGCGDQGFTSEDFKYTIKTDGVTLRQLTELVYRLKGSKYDWWYELFSGISEKQIDENSLTIDVHFNYGS